MREQLLAKVYVDKTAFHFDKAFDYLIPEEFRETLKPGCRVMVPFGNGNRKRQGIVSEIIVQTEGEQRLKPIARQLDKTPVFDDERFEMAYFLVKHTFCTFYEAVKTILPSAYQMKITQSYEVVNNFSEEDLARLSEKEKIMFDFLNDVKQSKPMTFTLKEQEKLLEALLEKGFIQRIEHVRQKVSDKTVQMMRLTCQDLDEFNLTPKQREAAEFLLQAESASKKEVMYFCAVGESVLNQLVKKGVAQYFKNQVFRRPKEEQSFDESIEELTLSIEQQQVFDGIADMMSQEKAAAALLHGVTGSGKTLVFVKLIDLVIKQGKQALMLVPEISLTPQIVGRLQGIFGDKVAVMHSNLSLGERLDEYQRIEQGKAQIVVGTRSAVFAPMKKIGLIIMDEEGEASYKSDAAPRYHAREIAKLRCLRHNAVLLLASATPSIESYYKASRGLYRLFTLENRYAGAMLPEVYSIDMKEEEENANTVSVSRMLRREIDKNLEKGEQSILFINRRGYHTVARCLSCGEVVKCPHCDAALTYHRDNGYMMCHYCGYAQKYDPCCPECHSPHMKLSGLGTQKIENELTELFPTARILRMDADTTYSRYAYSEKFEAFRKGEYDILVGTQMIAKGLDFPNVTLAGVLNADSGLYSNDYRGVERVFSLITQVVGRSGRAQKTGRAYIQSYDPENPVLLFAAQQNYKAFYEDEIVSRKALLYPPFCDICTVNFSGVMEKSVDQAANVFLHLLKIRAQEIKQNRLSMKVMGPMKPVVYRMNNKYRQRILIKCHCNAVFRQYLRSCLIKAGEMPQFRKISVYVDINGDIGG